MDALGRGSASLVRRFPRWLDRLSWAISFFGAALLHESGPTPARDANLVRALGGRRARRWGWCRSLSSSRAPRRPPRHDGAERTRPAPGDRRCVDEDPSARHRRGGGAARANHRRSGRGDRPLPEDFCCSDCCRRALMRRHYPICEAPGAVIAVAQTRAPRRRRSAGRRGILPVLELDPLATRDAAALTQQATQWAAAHAGELPVVIAASAARERGAEGAVGSGCRGCAAGASAGRHRQGLPRSAFVA